MALPSLTIENGPLSAMLQVERDRVLAVVRDTGVPTRAIRSTSSVETPHVVGLWRPAIVLPVSIVRKLEPAEL